MKRVVYKYSIDKVERVLIPVPFKIIHVGEQDGEIKIWAEIDPTSTVHKGVEFKIVATGEEFNAERLTFLKTVIRPSGTVWHVYLVTE